MNRPIAELTIDQVRIRYGTPPRHMWHKASHPFDKSISLIALSRARFSEIDAAKIYTGCMRLQPLGVSLSRPAQIIIVYCYIYMQRHGRGSSVAKRVGVANETTRNEATSHLIFCIVKDRSRHSSCCPYSQCHWPAFAKSKLRAFL